MEMGGEVARGFEVMDHRDEPPRHLERVPYALVTRSVRDEALHCLLHCRLSVGPSSGTVKQASILLAQSWGELHHADQGGRAYAPTASACTVGVVSLNVSSDIAPPSSGPDAKNVTGAAGPRAPQRLLDGTERRTGRPGN